MQGSESGRKSPPKAKHSDRRNCRLKASLKRERCHVLQPACHLTQWEEASDFIRLASLSTPNTSYSTDTRSCNYFPSSSYHVTGPCNQCEERWRMRGVGIIFFFLARQTIGSYLQRLGLTCLLRQRTNIPMNITVRSNDLTVYGGSNTFKERCS